ncbi:MAG: segregation and condensation protein [Patescibacteria group bacterium]|nr:segregation and condensation protein [Patescibacteria group bacterium]
MPISVKTAVYEGPLDLLLELIEKRKLLINDITLSAVTDEYIARVNSMTEMPVGETAEFISLAATLLLIKSRSLLPTLQLSPEESRDIKQLEYRLAVYQLIKEAGRVLGLATKRPYLHEVSTPQWEPLYIFDPAITPDSLRQAGQALIDGFPTTLTLPKIAVKKIISLEEMIEQLAARVSSAFALSFREFSGLGRASETDLQEHKHTVIVSFLALLELVKQGILQAQQHEQFGDITLQSDAVSTPRYE